MGRCVWIVALIALAGTSLSARAQDQGAPAIQPYFASTTVDLTMLLPPPPAPDSSDAKAELAEVLVVQITRTPDMAARAEADAVQEVWRFADVLGPRFSVDTLPRTAALFDRLHATDEAVLDPAKAAFNRARPAAVSDLVHPLVKSSPTGSWPSSHSSFGTLMGIVLADMVPEKRAAIMDRAWNYAQNRIVVGAHFPSDVEMGRIAGTVIAAAAMHDPAFTADFAAARKELRAALGL